MVSKFELRRLEGYVQLVGEALEVNSQTLSIPENLLSHANTQFNAMERIVERMQKIKVNQQESRLGGVMILAQEGEYQFSLIREVGEIVTDKKRIALDKSIKYTDVALGKYKVLLAHPKFISSSQNITDLTKEERLVVQGLEIPGGALRFGDGSISIFSGFGTPEEDECVVIASKVLVGDITKLESIEFAKQIGNNIYVSSVDYLIGHSDVIPDTLREETRYGHKFGDSQLTGESKETLELFYSLLNGEDTDYEKLALILGWSEGCPVVPEVIERGGYKEAAKGYAELQFIRGNILDLVKKYSPNFYHELTATRKRREGELAGKYDLHYTPQNHSEYTRGAATAVGYILPRLVREFIGKRGSSGRAEQTLRAYDLFEKVLKRSTKRKSIIPTRFAVELAEELILSDKDGIEAASRRYLSRLLSVGKLTEDNQYADYSNINYYIEKHNGNLWLAQQKIKLENDNLK